MHTAWDLSGLFASFEEAIGFLEKIDTESFEKKWKGRISKDLYEAIDEFEILQEKLSLVGRYAFLNYAISLNDQKVISFYQKTEEIISIKSTNLSFFSLELAEIERIPYDERLFKYETWINHVRIFKPFNLLNEVEKVLIEKRVTSRSSWIKLYDQTLASIQFEFEDKMLSISEITDLVSNEDEKIRECAAISLAKGLEKNIFIFVHILNSILKDDEIDQRLRKFDHPESSMHIFNDTTKEIVDSLVKAVEDSYKNLSHKYYFLKAKALGKDKLKYYDRNAPLNLDNVCSFSYKEAKDIVLKSYSDFHPTFGEIVKKFFDNNWIDSEMKSSKISGAFSCATPKHPYILLNFQGKVRDVMTLAHELGHGIHQYLSREVGELQSDTPLTIAETASVFGEMLTFQSIYKNCSDNSLKRYILAAKIDDKLNTVVRQIAFFDFEREVHFKRKENELSKQDFYDAFIRTQKKALGDFVEIDEFVGSYFSYISHFFHSPFYVYSYAFGDCLVNSLYARYISNKENFVPKYIKLLSSGGSEACADLLRPFDIDLENKDFWNEGLSFIGSLIDEFEKTL